MAVNSFKEQVTTFYDELPPWGKAAAVGVTALAIYIPYKWYSTRPRKSPLKDDFKKGIVYMYQFPRVKYAPSASPYCLKLETWLRMADIQYENVPCGYFTRSLEGTVPFLEYNGREYPDSSLAIRDMIAIHSKEPMESHLNDEQKAAARAFEKLAECSLLHTIALDRATDNIDNFLPLVIGDGPLASIFKCIAKRMFSTRVPMVVKLAGIGKHSKEEIINIASDDLRALSHYLGAKHYFTGFKPTRVDAALFGVLSQIVYVPYEFPQKKLIFEELTNLKDYCDRIKGRYWPDWEECVTKGSISSDWKKKN